MNKLAISEEYKPILEKVKKFIIEEIEPVEEEFHQEIGKNGDRWKYTDRMMEILESLKTKAKEEKLWNFFSPDSSYPGAPKITNLDYAYLAEQMGMSSIASEVFNCAKTLELTHLFLDVGTNNVPAAALYTSKGFIHSGNSGALPPPREFIREIELVLKQ